MSEFDPTTDTGGTQLQGSADTGEGVLMDDWDALTARVAALEQTPAPGPLTIEDLPLADLQRELTNNWAPSASDLLLPHSVTASQLDVAGVLNAYVASVAPQANRGLQLLRGFIDGRGASFAILSGEGFTAVRTGVGAYTITPSGGFSFATNPAVGCSCGGAGLDTHILNIGVTVNQLKFQINNAVPAATDDFFGFIAIG